MAPHFSDFALLDLEGGWERPVGYPEGVGSKLLAGYLDEAKQRGRQTSLTRWEPGTRFDKVLAHDYVEEVLVLEGELLCIDDSGAVVDRIPRNSYVCRPAGVPHGPFRSDTGFVSVEFCYYPNSE